MIYFVEDDDNIRELVIYTLQAVGFEALGFDNAKTFYEAMENQTPILYFWISCYQMKMVLIY